MLDGLARCGTQSRRTTVLHIDVKLRKILTKKGQSFHFAPLSKQKMLIITSLQPYGFPTVGPSNDYPCVQLAYCIWFAYW